MLSVDAPVYVTSIGKNEFEPLLASFKRVQIYWLLVAARECDQLPGVTSD